MGGEVGKSAKGWAMREFKVPLQIFGPKAFYHWLFHGWESLEGTSRNALRLLYAQTALSGTTDERQLMKLATTFEYERMLTALTEEDFKQFIEWALDYERGELWPEGWPRPPIPLSLNDLDIDIQKLRQLLILTFAKERIWASTRVPTSDSRSPGCSQSGNGGIGFCESKHIFAKAMGSPPPRS